MTVAVYKTDTKIVVVKRPNGIQGKDGLIQSVTGLDTDNTDPANPIIKISVDGVTIEGDGTPSNPLSAIGGGGSAVWGGIAGTLSNQTDLQNALNAKANLSGATFSGSISATNLSGTNTGDQTITLSGDVTGSGTGSFATTIANDAVTFAKMQNVSTNILLGRHSVSSGNVEEILLGTNLSLAGNTLNAAAYAPSGGAGEVQFADGFGNFFSNGAFVYDLINDILSVSNLTVTALINGGTLTGNNSGDTPSSGGAGEIQLADGAGAFTSNPAFNYDSGTDTLNVKIIATDAITVGGNPVAFSGDNISIFVNDAGYITGNQSITLSGDVTGSGTTGIASTIANDAVTFAKMQNIATDSLLGRDTAGTGDVENITLNATLSMTGSGVLQRAALTGDMTAPAGSNATTLATVNSNVGTFGSATRVGVITVNAKGLITAASDITITPAVGSITGLGSGVGTWLATPSSSNLAAAVTDETGSGALVFANTPTFIAPLLGTPTSGTLTNCTGLPIAGLVASTSAAIGVGSVELGNASDTTLSRSAAGVLAVEGVNVPTISSTSTLTNKRLTPRVGTTTSSATPTINTDNVDIYSLTAQTVDITSFTTNLSGTPTDGQLLRIQITGTAARAITWGSSFEASTVALPTTTVSTNRLDVGFTWNSATSKWRCIAVA